LNAQGIFYLWGSDVPINVDGGTIDSVKLLQRLVTCGYPLVENASISLLILHPDLAPAVVEALRSSEQEVIEKLAVITLATLYLQQWWFFRLTFALGQFPSFPEAPFASLWEERHLPSPFPSYGLDGLLALQEYQQHKFGAPLNFLDDWQNQINHLLAQEEAHQRQLSEDLRQALIKLSVKEQ
jgi:hypothetical protein